MSFFELYIPRRGSKPLTDQPISLNFSRKKLILTV
jgi:hypothetical protein